MADKLTTSQKATAGIKVPTGTKSIASQSIAALRMCIDGEVTEVERPARGDKPASTSYQQKGILKGGSRLLPFTHTSYEKEQTHEEGVYILGRDALRLSPYNNLEFNRYAELIRVGDLSDADRGLFDTPDVDMSDIL